MSSVTPPSMVLNNKAHDVTGGISHNGQENRHRLMQQPEQEIRGPQRQDAPPLSQVKSRRHLHTLVATTFRPWERLSEGQMHIINQQNLAQGVPGVDIKQPCIKASPGGSISGKLPPIKHLSLKRRKAKKAHKFRQTENIMELVETLFKEWFLKG
ncbi:hypothetical protein [Thalassomonas actiniarum]|uniref:Uncharacterized protein n=1 Tax=Thalassomonas actiniarum TaxID=485447 RepID=A0AAE9YZJ9_9GAMM|nr:hypothetical protein [Thalassomonas actiniarum]WDE02507.1 hypothetical protein SG35_029295 [Thalassomonas actiniarum]